MKNTLNDLNIFRQILDEIRKPKSKLPNKSKFQFPDETDNFYTK